MEEGEGNEIIIKAPQEDLLDDEWHEDVKIPLCELCVWVDPLDGTKEFTEGRYEYVSTLIGISCQGHPVAGIISEPYRHWAGFAKSLFCDLWDSLCIQHEIREASFYNIPMNPFWHPAIDVQPLCHDTKVKISMASLDESFGDVAKTHHVGCQGCMSLAIRNGNVLDVRKVAV